MSLNVPKNTVARLVHGFARATKSPPEGTGEIHRELAAGGRKTNASA